jgi:hypothetical protein
MRLVVLKRRDERINPSIYIDPTGKGIFAWYGHLEGPGKATVKKRGQNAMSNI